MRAKTKLIQVECICSTHDNLLSEPWYNCVTRQAANIGQQVHVCWLQVHTWHDHSYIAWIPLLHVAHGLTVKLSPCQCNHGSLAGRIFAFQCGHSKCNLLLAQAHPRIIQHLSSIDMYNALLFTLVTRVIE